MPLPGSHRWGRRFAQAPSSVTTGSGSAAGAGSCLAASWRGPPPSVPGQRRAGQQEVTCQRPASPPSASAGTAQRGSDNASCQRPASPPGHRGQAGQGRAGQQEGGRLDWRQVACQAHKPAVAGRAEAGGGRPGQGGGAVHEHGGPSATRGDKNAAYSKLRLAQWHPAGRQAGTTTHQASISTQRPQ